MGNGYTYAGNNPGTLIDPLGLASFAQEQLAHKVTHEFLQARFSDPGAKAAAIAESDKGENAEVASTDENGPERTKEAAIASATARTLAGSLRFAAGALRFSEFMGDGTEGDEEQAASLSETSDAILKLLDEQRVDAAARGDYYSVAGDFIGEVAPDTLATLAPGLSEERAGAGVVEGASVLARTERVTSVTARLGSALTSFKLRLGIETTSLAADISISSNGTSPKLPMTILRLLPAGSATGVVDEAKVLTYRTGNEHAVVRLLNGERAFVSGGPGGFTPESTGDVRRLIFHTHPYFEANTGPSTGDREALRALGQVHSYVIQDGLVTRFGPPSAP